MSSCPWRTDLVGWDTSLELLRQTANSERAKIKITMVAPTPPFCGSNTNIAASAKVGRAEFLVQPGSAPGSVLGQVLTSASSPEEGG